LAEAERLSPGDPESRIWLLNEFNLMGDYSSAEMLAREILRRDPFYFPARMNLASLLLEEGDLAGSIRESEKVLEQNPNITNCIRTLAVTYLEAGRPDKARSILSRARPADRGNFQLRLAWALLLATEGRSLEARLELDDSTRRWAGIVPFTVIWVAEIYSVLGNTDSGIEWLQKAIRIGDRRLAWFRRNPHLDFIRRDQRFERILASAIPAKP
jgi:tetratricopeptide (TPR) repeat protein